MNLSLLIFLAVLFGLLLCYYLTDRFSQSSEKQYSRLNKRKIVKWSPTSRAELRRNKYITYNF